KALCSLIPAKLAKPIVRWKKVALTTLNFQISRSRPSLKNRLIRLGVARQLPHDYAVDTHFKPRYDPWDQRLCLVPNGDLFKALRHGRASVVTDHIDTFTETGLKLRSGAELQADVIVTATGLNLLAFGGLQLIVDGLQVELPEVMTYKGMMLSGVPNYAFSIGYTNASWTLKADLTCEYVCRLLAHMDDNGHSICVPDNRDASVTPEPFLDFQSGYVLRSLAEFPKQGSKAPWKLRQNYALDVLSLRYGSVQDAGMQFSSPEPSVGEREKAAA
ncbi:MAG: NAD(P)/FAD-dependent oxidoreductase, partial [Frankiales bacterium]|nr:NAD(P)/FAD-dependent oxidoreductase [Frankiales bacterium]